MNHFPLLKMAMARNAREVFFKVISQQNKAWGHGWMSEVALNIKNELNSGFSLWCLDGSVPL